MQRPDWQSQRLDSVAEVIDPHPSHRAPPIFDQGIPFVGIGDVSEDGQIDASSARSVSPLIAAEHRLRYTVAAGDIGFGRVATVGKIIRFGTYAFDFTLSPTLALIKPRGIDRTFLIQYLQSQAFDEAASRLLTGTTRSSLGIQLLRKLEVTAPTCPKEQAAIGATLDTLDTTIRQTEAIIEKLKQVKQGLLHDLLTRGIDANGELRPPQNQAPHLYKISSLGWIPREWTELAVRQVVAEVANGASIRADEFRSAGTPVIAKGDVTTAKYIDTSRRIQFVDAALATSKYKGSMVNRNFVICSMRDLVPSAPTLGMASLLDADLDGLLAQGATALRLEQDRFHSELFVEITRQPWFRTKMRALAVGSTQVHMRGRDYLDVAIPAPPIAEQHKIIARVQAVDESVEAHKKSVATLQATKCGLMEDLLTGRVRVTPLLQGQAA